MKLFRNLQRISRFSPKKKAAGAGFTILFASVVAAAYARNTWVLGILVFVFLVAALCAVMRLDQRLRSIGARHAAAQERPGALAWWGRKSQMPRERLVQRLTKLRSVDGRDVLVSSVTSGRWSWADMAVGLEMYRIGGEPRERVRQFLASVQPAALLPLADLCFRQNILRDDMLNASTLYGIVFQALGEEPFTNKRSGEFFLDSLARTDQGSEALRLQSCFKMTSTATNDLQLYRANAANPLKNPLADFKAWLGAINAVYEKAGLARLSLREGSESAFLRLAAETPEPVTGGPVVTIIMPIFRPDDFTDLAIRSAVEQSYQNIEIIIVDDGSGGDAEERLNKWAEADNRITVVLSPENSGAYTSRNIGFSMASGEFLTIFDGDDWQHPQKIEMLVRAAEKQPDRRLVSVPWARVDEDLFFQYRGWRGSFITPAHVSTMFHVDTIRQSLGYWDSVRKGADTEFILRYRALVQPDEPLQVCEVPLTLSLVNNRNLSFDEFRLGYRAPERVAYRASYEHWHQKIRAGSHSGYLPFPHADRAFPAPARYLAEPQRGLELDVLFVGDFGDDSPRFEIMFDHVRSAQEQGSRVGLMHMPSLLHTFAIDKGFSAELMDQLADRCLHRVEVTDRVMSTVVRIYDPTAFQYRLEYETGHRAERVEIWTDEAPYDLATGNHNYEVGSVERHAADVFGGPVLWSPLSKASALVVERSRQGSPTDDPKADSADRS